jgi:hypothetical protein
MVIACLGWGSLIWCQKRLPVKGEWQKNGPSLPIELTRESRDKRITLVICDGAPNVTALWAALDVKTLAEAKNALADREGIPQKNISKNIGFWTPNDSSKGLGTAAIESWAKELDLEGVVWTALQSKIANEERTPVPREVIDHLNALNGRDREIAEEYVRLAPRQIVTPYRTAIEKELRWTPTGLV